MGVKLYANKHWVCQGSKYLFDFVNGSSNTAVGTDSFGGSCLNNQPASLNNPLYSSSVTILWVCNWRVYVCIYTYMVDWGFFNFRSLNFTSRAPDIEY